MIVKAFITPTRTRGNVTIVGSYRDRKTDKEYFLSTSGKKVTTSIEEDERVFQHTFQDGYPLTITLDDSDFQSKAVIDFWKNHPLVSAAGYSNPNLVGEQFIFEIKNEKVKADYDSLIGKLTCVSQVTAMNEQERRNLAFALGSDPRGMSNEEVYISLIGLTLGGIAIAKRELVSTFLTVRSAERIATIYANKAIQYGIIRQEGSVYKIGGRNCGTTIDSVISMIMSDNDMFENYIKPEVDKIDKDELAQMETIGDSTLELPEEIENLLPSVSARETKRVPKANTK